MTSRAKENLFLYLGVALFITFVFTLAMCSGCAPLKIPMQSNPTILEESILVEKDILQCNNLIKTLRTQMMMV